MRYFSRIILVLIFVAIVWFVLFTVGAIRIRGKNYKLGNNISQIVSQSLKTSDSQKSVIEFLDSHGLSDRQIVTGKKAANEYSLVKELGQTVKGFDSVIIVLIPDVEHSLGSQFNVTIVFYFDKQRKMIDFRTQKMGVGL